MAIVKVEDKRAFKAPKLTEATPEIKNTLAQKQRVDYVQKLRDAAKIVQ